MPKRVKNLQRKALKEAAGTSQTAQKGWPRGYEFKVHRMTRKFRNDWIHEPEDSFAGSTRSEPLYTGSAGTRSLIARRARTRPAIVSDEREKVYFV